MRTHDVFCWMPTPGSPFTKPSNYQIRIRSHTNGNDCVVIKPQFGKNLSAFPLVSHSARVWQIRSKTLHGRINGILRAYYDSQEFSASFRISRVVNTCSQHRSSVHDGQYYGCGRFWFICGGRGSWRVREYCRKSPTGRRAARLGRGRSWFVNPYKSWNEQHSPPFASYTISSLPDFLPRCHGGRVLNLAYTARTEIWSRCAPSTRTVRPVRTAVCERVAVVWRRTEQPGAFGLRRAAVGGIGMPNFLAAPCHALHSKFRLTTPTGSAPRRGPAAWYGATSR